MKRFFCLLIGVLVLLLSACAKEPSVETLPAESVAETTVPVETEPELAYVTAQVNGVPAVLKTFSRDDTLNIVEAFDEKHYVVKLAVGYGLVEKNLVRMEQESASESRSGYSYHNVPVYDNYRLAGKPVKRLAANTQVEVLEDLGWCVLVAYEGNAGYMKQEHLAKAPRSSGGDGNEPAGSGSSSGKEEDGGEISLRFSGKATLLATITPQGGDSGRRARVLADGTEVVLGYFDRGDRIPVLKETVGQNPLTVYLEGLYATVSPEYVCGDGEKTYTVWEGYSRFGAEIYDDFWMLGSPVDRLNADVAVRVLYELENCYLVEAGAVTGYIAKDMVTVEKAEPVPSEAPAQREDATSEPEQKPEGGTAEPPVTNPTEGNSGGNASPEWTPPVL